MPTLEAVGCGCWVTGAVAFDLAAFAFAFLVLVVSGVISGASRSAVFVLRLSSRATRPTMLKGAALDLEACMVGVGWRYAWVRQELGLQMAGGTVGGARKGRG